MSYAELVSRSCFSLLQGASHPEELVEAAVNQGLSHFALTDRDAVYGLPQAYREAERRGLELVCGATITVVDLPPVVLLAENHEGWSNLCRMITAARARAQKGFSSSTLEELLERSGGLTCGLLAGWTPQSAAPLADTFGDRLEVVLSHVHGPTDGRRTRAAVALSTHFGRPLLASNDVRYHLPERRRLADVLTCIRRKCTLDQGGKRLATNAERYVLSPDAFRARFADHPSAVRRTLEVAERCRFRMTELSYVYPREVVPESHTAMSWLRELVAEGAAGRFPEGAPPSLHDQLEHELSIIEDLDFPSYFLTVNDIVRFARGQGILCQGRGSAANSAVCYVLGITAVDPSRTSLLFERFISRERGEPPDIDVDFEHERREEVIQYIYERYGRDRASMVNNIITWRSRSAARDVGKVFGLTVDQVDRMAGLFSRWARPTDGEDDDVGERLVEVGLDPRSHAVHQTLEMAGELSGMPRHLGIHPGGFVISDGPLLDLVPVEPATMADRHVVQWDKYGVESLGFVKVDVLALGILTAIRKAFQMIEGHCGRALALHTVPAEDPAVYEMFRKADTVGVFQIESRAQMSMLPRLKPACFYDLVIEVAIVRPGPIQGGMVHPYLRRRAGEEAVTYAHPALEPILARTLGVPLFQEQVMQMAVAVGGFTPGEADALRRAMGAWRKRGGLDGLGRKLVEGMIARDIDKEYAEAIYSQIRGFGEYGFPESHSASFALLVYISGWIKCHYPAAFCAAIINSQPMGFYSPRSLVLDAQQHGVEVRPVSVTESEWDCTLESDAAGAAVIRLGLRLVRGFDSAAGEQLVAARRSEAFRDLPDLARRTGLKQGALQQLADAGALDPLTPERRQAAWIIQGLWTDLPLFAGLGRSEPEAALPKSSLMDAIEADYRAVGLSIDNHPATIAREELIKEGVPLIPLGDLVKVTPGEQVQIVGLVASRQRPGTASGVVFMALEDDTGLANLIIWPKTWLKHRKLAATSPLLGVVGRLQRQDDAFSVLVEEFWSVESASGVYCSSRDFR